jgi:hypothetical protein
MLAAALLVTPAVIDPRRIKRHRSRSRSRAALDSSD